MSKGVIGSEVTVSNFKDIILTHCETNQISLDEVPEAEIVNSKERVQAFSEGGAGTGITTRGRN